MEISDAEKSFLIGLEKLTRETGIIIGGCGCCGSPFLGAAKEEELITSAGYGFGSSGQVEWIYPSDERYWNKFSDSIVKVKEGIV